MQCLPCPAGRVCGTQGMVTLATSTTCPEGYTCGVGTDRNTQFLHKCPAAYYCATETSPDAQYEYVVDLPLALRFLGGRPPDQCKPWRRP